MSSIVPAKVGNVPKRRKKPKKPVIFCRPGVVQLPNAKLVEASKQDFNSYYYTRKKYNTLHHLIHYKLYRKSD